MKKVRKNKKQIEKGKWSVGKTIASVISSVALISGVTVLGVYLSGGFEETVVNPQSINFDYSGLQYSNGQLEISGVESFSLTISSPTENVTRKKVALSFGEGVDYSRANGYISNKIIQVPEEVELGEAFTVRLLQKSFAYDTNGDGENDLTFDSIAGGISTLIAKSEYNQINSQSLQIAVDTPVYKITNYLVDMSGNTLEKIGANQEFKVASKFYPEESRYMFADNLNSNIANSAKREKLVLFGVTDGTNYIEMNVGENFDSSFKVGSEIVDNIKIEAYSFKDAKSQLEMLGSLNEGSLQSKYSELYGKLVASSGENVSNTNIAIEMASASISSFDIGKAGTTITVTDGEEASIYVNGINGVSLDAQILSTDDETLTYLLENIALEFVKLDGTPLDMANIEVGGRTFGDNKFLTIDGHKLYLPYNNVSNKNNCYWDITSSLTQDIKVNVYLVVETAEGQTLFGTNGNVQVKSFTLHTKEVEDEVPSFVDQDVNFNVPQEVVTLDIASGGTGIVPKTIDLREFIVIPANNKYTSVQFFVRAQNNADIADIINGPFNGTTEDGWTKLIDDSITIKGAGSFELKFATTKPDGTIVKNCEASKTFICQQALSQESIVIANTQIKVTQANMTVTETEAYLTQMQNDKIELSFALSSASSSVFANEFNSNKISLSVFSGSEDISNKFSIVAQPVTTASTKLEYTLTVLGELDAEKEITRFTLVYKKDASEGNNILWNIDVPFTIGGETGPQIFIYSPITESVSLIGNPPTNVSYNQKLNSNGDLEQTITNIDTGTNITNLVQAVIGNEGSNITITDQHHRTDTLAGQWAFEVISGRDAINLEPQTFSIKGNGEIKIKIKATKVGANAIYAKTEESEEDYQLNISSTSTGVDHLTYQSGKKHDEIGRVTGEKLSSVTVEKYGMEGEIYALADLVKYYLDEEEKTEYTKVAFKFASSYFLGLTDAQIVDLYGNNGMLSVTLEGEEKAVKRGADAGDIKSNLENKNIKSITINKHFGRNHSIRLDITDENRVVDTAFTFNILNNLEISADDYSNKYCMAPFDLTNTISFIDKENVTDTNLKEVYNDQTLYIVPVTTGGYTLSASASESGTIGEVNNGQVTFYDFFDAESKTFVVSFNESNIYQRNLSISFTILRNIIISAKNQPFYIIDNANTGIGSYLLIERKDTSAGALDFGNFTFTTSEKYLKAENNNVLVAQNNIKFGYNEETLTEVVTVSHESSGTKLGSVNISINLADFSSSAAGETLYGQIAGLLQSTSGTHGNVQKIGETKYIVFDIGQDGTTREWELTSTLSGKEIQFGGYKALYETDKTNVSFNSQAQTLAGYNNNSYYIVLTVSIDSANKITINVPIILSKVGHNPLSYNDDEYSLATALMSATELQSNGKFSSPKAERTITLNDFVRYQENQTLVYDAVGAEALEQLNLQINKDILKSFGTNEGKTRPTILLNHLSKEYGSIYLPLAWVVGDATFHYLIIVAPDVEVSDAIYAYNGDAEYIVCAKDNTETIDFSEEYGSSTLNSGKTRFEVYKLNDQNEKGDKVTTGLTTEYYIKSVIYGTNEFSNESQWKGVVSFDIVDSKVSITPKTNNPLTVIIGVRFVEGAKANDLAVICEEKTYTVVLNQNTSNYKVRVTNGVDNNKVGKLETTAENEYTWTISNINGGTRDLKIELLDASDSGSLSTIVYDLLQVQAIEGSKAIAKAEYNATSVANVENDIPATTLRLTLNDYIDANKTIKFTIFTKYGSLATLNVILTANANVELINSNATLTGGSETKFGDIFKVTLNNQPAVYSADTGTPDSPKYIINTKENDTNDISFDNDLVKFEDGKIKVANLFEDSEVTMTATLQFAGNAEQTYKFSQKFTLTKNVKLTVPASKSVVAMKPLEIKAEEFVNNGKNAARIMCEKSSEYAVAGDGTGKITITPNYVGRETVLTLKLTIKLAFGGVGQTQTIEYPITVLPAVEITPNYPNPSGKQTLDREYIKKDETFTNILAFFNDTATYAEKDSSRLQLKSITGKGEDGKYTYGTTPQKWSSTTNKPTITITECRNVKFTINGETYGAGATITDTKFNGEIKFSRDAGERSIITFMVTYNGVSAFYTVEVLDEVYIVDTNYQTNNIDSGDFETTSETTSSSSESETTSIPVTYEILYVDKTNISNLFVQDRMVKVQMNNVVTGGVYRFVFTDASQTNYYVSQDIAVLASDAGKSMTYDMGVSMTGKTFYGVFLASAIADSNMFTITDNKLASAQTDKTEEDLLGALTNYQESLFAKKSLTLASRLELTYGGTKVAYDKWSCEGNIASDSTNLLDKISKIDNIDNMVKLQMNNSVTAGVYRFVFAEGPESAKTYFVSQNIAILASDAGKVMTYDLGLSMHNKELYGVYLASNIADSSKFKIENGTLTSVSGEIENHFKTLVNYQENLFVKDKLALVSRVVTKPSGVDFTYYYMAKLDVDVDKKATTAQNYLTVNVNEECDSIVELFGIRHPTTNELVAKSEFTSNINLEYKLGTIADLSTLNTETSDAYSLITFSDNSTNPYLKIDVGKRNSGGGVYDFSFLPLGAKNDGNFVLTKLTYKANSFEKDFFIVLHILPDYRVTFSDVENGVEEDAGSNIILSNSQSMIRITELDGVNYKAFTLLSQNGKSGLLSIKHKNGLNTENELASSLFTATLTLNQNDYNNTTNFDSKLKDHCGGGLTQNKAGSYKLNGSKSTFTGVPKVVFGEQKYFIDLVDNYGYRVRLYFALSLESGVSPSQYSSSVAITEGEEVDITARYESLNIIKGTETDGNIPLTINSTYEDPSAATNVKVIELDGVGAYGFITDYANASIKYLTETSTGYDVNTDGKYSLDASMQKYLTIPTIKYVTVKSIKIVPENGTNPTTVTLDEVKTLATKEGLKFNGVTFRDSKAMFTMPELEPSVYGAGTSARVVIYIELQYTNGNNTEICTVPVNAVISRGLTLTDKTSVAKDGQTIALTGDDGIFTTGKEISGYINDTLEVKVPKGGSVEFELEYTYTSTNNETTSITKSRSISNVGYQYDKTYFVSISGLIGKNVKSDGSCNITVKQGSAEFKYNTGSAVPLIKGTFVASGSKELKVQVEGGKSVKFSINDKEFTIKNTEEEISWVSFDLNELNEEITDGSKYTITIINGNAIFKYNEVCILSNSFKFKIGSIAEDKITVDDAGLLVRDNYYTQDKYYLVGIKSNSDTKYYRVTKTYYITGTYYKMTNSSTSEIDGVLYGCQSGSITTPAKVWGKNLQFYDLSVTNGTISATTNSYAGNINNENLYFEIDRSEGDNSAPATMEPDGGITITSDFSTENYVKVNIYQKVSANENSKHFLCTVRLGLGNLKITIPDSNDNLSFAICGERQLEVKCKNTNISGAVTIPGTVGVVTGKDANGNDTTESWKVTSIADAGFKDCKNITSITIPDSVTNIGSFVFQSCHNLSAINIPASVNSIGRALTADNDGTESNSGINTLTVDSRNKNYRSEGNCIIENLTNTLIAGCQNSTIPDGVEIIKEYAFSGCKKIEAITLPNSLKEIRQYAFGWCGNLKTVNIPLYVASIGKGAFTHCGLTSVTFEEVYGWKAGATSLIVSDVNQNATWLSSTYTDNDWTHDPVDETIYTDFNFTYDNTTMTASVKAKDASVISGEIKIPAFVKHNGIDYTVTSIADAGFKDCKNITSIIIPDSVTSIGSMAFQSCHNLSAINIPASVESIGSAITADNDGTGSNTGITTLTVAKGNKIYRSEGNCIIEKSTNTLIAGCQNSTIPDGVEIIKEYAFSGCKGLREITLPNSIKDIQQYAFGWCDNLTTINIPENVTSIGERAFTNSGLTNVTFENIYWKVGDMSFNLSNPSTNAKMLTTTYADKTWNYTALEESFFADFVFTVDVDVKTASVKAKDVSKINEAVIPEFIMKDGIEYIVTAIDKQGFKDATSLGRLVIPRSVTLIGDEAFAGSGLVSINIPDNVTTIGARAFYNCTELRAVNFGENIELLTIQEETFKGCTELTRIEIPQSVISIGDYAFESTGLTSVEIPDSVTELGVYVFADTSNLSEVIIGVGISFIPSYCFSNCTSLEFIDIPDNVISIGYNAFENTGLTSVTIPKSVIYIYPCAFDGCELSEMIFEDQQSSSGWGPSDWFIFEYNSENTTEAVYNIEFENNSVKDITYLLHYTNYLWIKYLSCLDCDYNDNTLTATLTNINDNGVFSEQYGYFIPYIVCNKDTNKLYTITAIGDGVFKNSDITAIELPYSITKLGDGAFVGCENLISVVLPLNLTEIGSETFANCTSLEVIVITANIVSIEDDSFSGCEALNTIVIDSQAVNKSLSESSTLIENAQTIYFANDIEKISAYITDTYIQIESDKDGYTQWIRQ